MKKFFKPFLISMASLLVIVIVTISIAIWLVFTPKRITPIVRKQAQKLIACQSEIGEVELTFFSTFPHFGLKVSRLALINPFPGSSADTLLRADELTGIMDLDAWRKDKDLVLTGIKITNGAIHAFSDSLGNSNFDIMAATDTVASQESGGETSINLIDIQRVELENIDLAYTDLAAKMDAAINDLNAKITGRVDRDHITGDVEISRSGISFNYGGEQYLSQASIRVDLPVEVVPSRQLIRLNDASFTLNDLEIRLDGTVENDTLNKNIITDLRYGFQSWVIQDVMALIPSSFDSYFEGIEAEGIITSEGTISGILNDSLMPLMDVNLTLEDGKLQYAGFPFPLHDVGAVVHFYSDLKTDSLSFVDIGRLEAKTPQSSLKVNGTVKQLLSDIHCDLTTDAGLTLDEFNRLIPDSLKTELKGKLKGRIKTDFTLTQLQKKELEKMQVSGSLTLSDARLAYDSLSLQTDRSAFDFELPNRHGSKGETSFAYVVMQSDNLEAGKLEAYHALLQNADIILETSDVRDSTRIPDVICKFVMDSLDAGMDTLGLCVSRPQGEMALSPRKDHTDQPEISLSYSSDQLETRFGQQRASMKKISMDADVINDQSQQDIFLQWMVKGFIDMNEGRIILSSLADPIEIPAIKMDFEPETFSIKESSLRIDKSDFRLSGDLKNVLSYFRGDSILRGSFSFVSDTTDITALMALTNGLGKKDSTLVAETENADQDSVYTGPYIVPKGVDVLLTTNIRQALYGVDTITRINGNVRVHDGILVLDGLTFQTPAARMQLTAMYRTPRRNHLFLGLDYHMLDVEIGELLTMIPEIDSMMPMLRSFAGEAEFHIAAETYLDSMYNIKPSTVRGAASIKGQNLVLMDGETFSEIAKTLKFRKKTENKVDSLSAEFTLFRKEIDIYPFLIVMDKYKAVVAGRHNLDMTYDYHISVVDCPLPVKLGIDIKGNADDLSYKLAKCEYAEFYRPSSRREVENKQLELRKMIRDALTQKVIE